ncbi:MAG: hypothetical protein RLY31_3260 [Bacteroidota bacterium]|jgi:putative membrane protein
MSQLTEPPPASSLAWQSRGKTRLTWLVLLVTHLVGIVTVRVLGRTDILDLTPLQLLSCFGLLIWNHPEGPGRRLWQFLAVAFLTGYWVEVAGVATGRIFGSYSYGDILGPKILETPLLIGVNWAMLVYAGNCLANRWTGRRSGLFFRAMAGAVFPVALDILLEPVAIAYGMWSWESATPPLQNYLGWFAVSLVLSVLHQRWLKDCRNPVAGWLLLAQAAFFAALHPGW